MNDLSQPPQPRRARRRSRWLQLLLLVLVLGGALIWWWGPWRKWDVTLKFLGFEGAGGERTAIFEIANRSPEWLVVPTEPGALTYQLLSPDGEITTHAPKTPGGWFHLQPGASRQAKIPLICPDGTPITGRFRLGFQAKDTNYIWRLERLDHYPLWERMWIYKILPKSYFRAKTHVYWTEPVTP